MPFLLADLLQDLGLNLRVLAVQVVIFVTTFLLLSRILFGRVVRHMLQREEEIRASHAAIEASRAKVTALAKDYEARIAKIDKEAYDRMQEIFREALGSSGQILARAQGEARQQVEAARVEVAREKASALVTLRGEVVRLSLQAAEKVLDTKLDAAKGEAVRKFLAERTQA